MPVKNAERSVKDAVRAMQQRRQSIENAARSVQMAADRLRPPRRHLEEQAERERAAAEMAAERLIVRPESYDPGTSSGVRTSGAGYHRGGGGGGAFVGGTGPPYGTPLWTNDSLPGIDPRDRQSRPTRMEAGGHDPGCNGAERGAGSRCPRDEHG